ncbi:hypothetical protein AB835_04740 [Candidatus Endobugula sertula]|uniref:Replicative helicase inhibitor G39P N-terminal domain-containing protein n=1 Tax=Candidatus Endobugula sertula TaxID=62101 RepID=A0A1D2QRP0_9GAMM|nr:hypothetical protein AB835_04740 [Candidatus Endobugula sertula]
MQDNPQQRIEAINQSFEVLRINYHNQYFSAFGEIDALNSAKRLWLEMLKAHPASTILQAVHQHVGQSDYLPTISQISRRCDEIGQNTLPDVRSAYMEACRSTTPRRNYPWSHPAVYYAGQKADWFFLSNNSERTTYPIFKKIYAELCHQLANGANLPEIKPLALPDKDGVTLSKEQNADRLQKMREELGL